MATAADLLTMARQSNRRGDLGRAEQLCRQVLDAEPEHLKALYLVGAACHERGELDEALRCFDRVLRRNPASARAYHARGSVLRDKGDLEEAIRAFKEAVRLRSAFVAGQIALGMALQAQGKQQEAAEVFRIVVHLRPGLPEARLALGAALESDGKRDEAIACYQEALRLNPSSVAALNNLAALLLRQDQLAQAAECIAQALRIEPECAEAHYNQGTILHRRRLLPEALDCYERAVRLDPSFLPAYHALANALIEDGQHDAARDWIHQALRREPRQALAHANLGKLLLQEGRREEAAQSFREALRYDPNCVAALAPAAFFGTLPLGEAERVRMRGLLARGNLSAADASRLDYGLGTLSDRDGAVDEAFAHFRQANVLRRQSFRDSDMVFDRDRHRAWVDQLIATCDADYFRRIQRMGRSTKRPVFIVGMPRSGTSLVEQILASHPDVFGAGELRDIDRIAHELPARLANEAYPPCLRRLDEVTARSLADRYLERLGRLNGAAVRVTDKMPLNFLHLGLIAALFSRARVVHCVRDPLDVCLSCYFQDFGSVTFSCDLKDLGSFYRDYVRLMAHWRKVLPLALMDVVYEDLVERPEPVTRQLVSFCGLPWDARCLTYHQNPRPVHTASQVQVRQPVYKSSVGRWRRYSKYLRPLFEALGRPVEQV
jgi:tetratricopeptide (TPR) repeat protein